MQSSRRSLTAAFAVLAICVAGSAPAGASAPDSDFLAQVNGLRTSRGLTALEPNQAMQDNALQWATTMMKAHALSHQPADALPGSGTRGENVGSGPSVDAIFQALSASPSHLANMLGTSFHFSGVAVAEAGDGTLFVAEEFADQAPDASQGQDNAPVKAASVTSAPAPAVTPSTTAPPAEPQQQQQPVKSAPAPDSAAPVSAEPASGVATTQLATAQQALGVTAGTETQVAQEAPAPTEASASDTADDLAPIQFLGPMVASSVDVCVTPSITSGPDSATR